VSQPRGPLGPALPPGPVGARVSVRVRVGERTKDLLGVLEQEQAVRRRDGSLVAFDLADVIAWKEVPAPYRVRMRLYDTASRDVVEVRPSRSGLLRIYACGPTVYRYAHVGNLRTFLLTDLVGRVAELAGLRVQLVQNITDVGHLADDSDLDDTEGGQGEDKVLAQARAEGKDPFAVARFYEEAFHKDLAALNIRPAEAYPRASESIEMMIELINTLISKGHAYVGNDGSVFFDARSFDSYGHISGNRLDQLRPGHRFDGEVDSNKRFHADWALWKRAGTNRQMVWDSPWGEGFPGWHIECSAMSLALIGDTIDIHTGGIDLRFPHHEDERAQSNAAVAHEVVRHWVHGEHLLFEGRKMSKSTGNVVLLSDLSDRGLDPLSLRLAFLENRYRSQMDLTWASLEAANTTLTRWRRRVAEWAEAPSRPIDQSASEAIAALNDDLDSPRAIQILRRLERASEVEPGAKFETFVYLDRVFGLDLASEVGKRVTLPEGAEELLAQRAAARTAKDFPASDQLRDQLAQLGVVVRDTPTGQEWELA
jgi:cysteinyl-tRNA synthetase